MLNPEACGPEEDRYSSADELAGILERLAVTELLQLALDFDGTLAPFVNIPDAARMLPPAREAITLLRDTAQTRIALVSGRPVANLAHVSGDLTGVGLVGSHGAQSSGPGLPENTRVSVEEEAVLAPLRQRLGELVARVDGSRLEVKPLGVAIHSRGMEAAGQESLQAEAADIARSISEKLLTRYGKAVIEFSVRSATKGDGIRLLKEIEPEASLSFFAGDDATDEDAFAALGSQDLGMKVGGGATQARYRIADPEAFCGWLLALAKRRKALKGTKA